MQGISNEKHLITLVYMELEGLTSLYVGEFFGLAGFVIVLVVIG